MKTRIAGGPLRVLAGVAALADLPDAYPASGLLHSKEEV